VLKAAVHLLRVAEGGVAAAEVTLEYEPDESELSEQITRLTAIRSPGLPESASYDAHSRLIRFTLPQSSKPIHALSEREGPLSSQQVSDLARALSVPLKALHDAGLGALDLDPELVLANDDCTTVVIIPAVWLSAGPMAVSQGQCAYTPPELSADPGSVTQPAADIFCLGALLWRMLAAASPEKTSANLFSEAYPNVAQAELWDELLDGALRSNPDRRFPTLDELIGALPSKAAKATSQVSMQRRTQKGKSQRQELGPEPPSPRSRWLMFAGASAIGVIAIMVILSSLGGGGDGKHVLNSVLRYADRNYDESVWREVATVTAITASLGSAITATRESTGFDFKSSYGPLFDIDGVDDENFWLADKQGRIVKRNEGHWAFVGHPEGAHYPHIAAIDGDRALVAGGDRTGRSNNHFIVFDKEGFQAYETWRWLEGVSTAVIAEDYALMGATKPHLKPVVFRFVSGRFEEIEPDKDRRAYIHHPDNAPLSEYHSGNIHWPHLFREREEAYGMWLDPRNQKRPLIVRFQDNVWFFVEELTMDVPPNSLKAAWFGKDNEGVFTVAASDNGRVILHRVGQKSIDQTVPTPSGFTTSMQIVAVWGRSADQYWVMDSSGTVFERHDRVWRPVVRGLYTEDVNFDDVWVSASGSVFAITEEKLFRLD